MTTPLLSPGDDRDGADIYPFRRPGPDRPASAPADDFESAVMSALGVVSAPVAGAPGAARPADISESEDTEDWSPDDARGGVPLAPKPSASAPAVPVTTSGEPIVGQVVAHQGLNLPKAKPLWPLWIRDAEIRRATWEWAPGYLKATAAHHGVRVLPVYAPRLSWRAVVGLGRAVATTWRWVFDFEQRELRRLAIESGNPAVFLSLRRELRDTVRARLAVSGAGALVGTGALWAAAVAWPLALPVTGAAAFGLAAVNGRPRDGRTLLTNPDLPVKLDFSYDLLNAAFRAVGLLSTRAVAEGADAPALRPVQPTMRLGNGWLAVFDLPRGSGRTAAEVLAKRDAIAAELGVDEIQVIMARVRAAAGGNAGRISMWVADDDPYLGPPTVSPLETAASFDVWNPIPFGHDARGREVMLSLMWQSMFFGGLPRRGKTFSQRIPSAAGVLDAWVQHFVADGKGGADWMPMRAVAHRLVLGAEPDALAAFIAMLKELIVEMERRFTIFRTLPASVCPEGKLTPAISRRYKLPVIMVTIDELQEFLSAMDTKVREEVIEMLCRIARRAPAAGFISNFASQRPDADSVPTKLRDIVSYRYCTQVVDKASSDMVLGKGKASQGADASILSEEHKGVGVLVTGPASFEIVRVDMMDLPPFLDVCARGRALRIEAGTLTGDAAGDVLAAADAAGVVVPQIVSDVLTVMHHAAKMHTADLLVALAELDDDAWGDLDADKLAFALEEAGVVRTTKQVKISGLNLAGYRREDVEAVLPAEWFDRPGPAGATA